MMILRNFKIISCKVVASLFCKRTINIKTNILIIAPHPDDEVLGCGGLIQRALSRGVRVDVVILTNGEASHNGCCSESDIAENRTRLTYKAAQRIGLPKECVHKLNFRDGGVSLDDTQNVAALYQLFGKIRPAQIFIPHQNEGWSDHVIVKELLDRYQDSNLTIELYEYMVWSWYYVRGWFDWRKCLVLKMSSDEVNSKRLAINDYTTDIAPCGKPWSGTLPKMLVDACGWSKELYFKIR